MPIHLFSLKNPSGPKSGALALTCTALVLKGKRKSRRKRGHDY